MQLIGLRSSPKRLRIFSIAKPEFKEFRINDLAASHLVVEPKDLIFLYIPYVKRIENAQTLIQIQKAIGLVFTKENLKTVAKTNKGPNC